VVRPEVGLTDVRYVDTGDLPGINHITRLGLEGALQTGPISLQAEYIRTFLSREGAYGDAVFDGWYAYMEVLIKGRYWIKTKRVRGDLFGLRLFKP
jgi:phosphate-selective porin OprO/OprP